jgi:hypothetical protein
LPPCDGSFQDCVTPEGYVCEAGSTEHECESSVTCSDGVTVVSELSDCPNPAPNPFLDLLSQGASGVPFRETNKGAFNPDQGCLFNVDQPKCTPPEGVDCPEDFGTNEDGQCFPLNEDGDWECPPDYHSVDDDETSQCYPNNEGCPDGMVLREDEESCVDVDDCETLPNSRDCIDKRFTVACIHQTHKPQIQTIVKEAKTNARIISKETNVSQT